MPVNKKKRQHKQENASSSTQQPPLAPPPQGYPKKDRKSSGYKKQPPKKRFKCHFWFTALVVIFIAILLMPFLKDKLDADERIVKLQTELLESMVGPLLERPGIRLAREGFEWHHPVVFIPGIVSTGLEVWRAKPCAKKHFRKRFWGSSLMVQEIIMDRQCWIEHVKMNYSTWADPNGIKLRPASGLVAADYLVSDYWVWGKMIENLADIGYDESNMYMAAYDWRLAFQHLETRDHYFTRLKMQIELMYKVNHNRKVVVVTHSMGSVVMYYFMKWVESKHGAAAGPNWVNDHIESFVNVGGPMLGASKTIATLISGEMRDTAELNSVLQFVKDNFVSKEDLMNVFRSFGSLASMIPKGGNAVWGYPGKTAPDGVEGFMVRFNGATEKPDKLKGPKSPKNGTITLNTCNETVTHDIEIYEPPVSAKQIRHISKQGDLGIEETLDMLRSIAPSLMQKIDALYSTGASDPRNETFDDPKYWTNPLQSTLPKAPNMTVYCLYGVGPITERSYHYKPDSQNCTNVPFTIDLDAHPGDADPSLSHGVRVGYGDGTVPLLSLGYMCTKGWSMPRYNPSGVKVVTREYEHEGSLAPNEAVSRGLTLDLFRGGAKTADHVDIMGNFEMIEDVINILAAKQPPQQRVVSKIQSFADNVNLD